MNKNKVFYIITIIIGVVSLGGLFPFLDGSPYYFATINHDPHLLGWSVAMFVFNVLAILLVVVLALLCLLSKKIETLHSLRFNNILTVVFYFGCALNLFFAIYVTTSVKGDLILHPLTIANYYYSLAFLISFVFVMIRSRKSSEE